MVSDANKRKRQSYWYLSDIYELITTGKYIEAMVSIAREYDMMSAWGTGMAKDSLQLLLHDKNLIPNESKTIESE